MAGWPSHLDLPAREDDGTSWNQRVDAHGLSVELLDAMWYAAAVDRQTGYKQKCLRWVGPYFPGSTAEERKVLNVEQNNMNSNVKITVLGLDYIGLCLQGIAEGDRGKSLRRSWASPAMRNNNWNVTVYDFIDRSWAVVGTYPVDTDLEYDHESTGRILIYAPPGGGDTPPPEEPNGSGDNGNDGNGGNGDENEEPHAPGEDQEEEKADEEEITEESTHLEFAGGVETMDTGEPMDVIEEVPTAHAAVTVPKEEVHENNPGQITPELKALGVGEGEAPEKVTLPQTFAKAMTPMHPSKFIDLNSDDDDPSGGTGSDTVATAVKLEVKTEPQPCALLGALMSSEPRVMDKKDKLVVTTGLKVMQHEDEVMKAMVGVSHLSESVHMLVLKDPTINLSSWNDLHVMTIDPNWEDTCKKLGLIPEPWTGCSVHGKAHLETDPRCPL